VLGGGSFGTAIANMLASNAYRVVLWMRNAQHAHQVQEERVNQCYLPGYKLAQSLQVSADLNACLQGVDTIFFRSSKWRSTRSRTSSEFET
jgi:glycerol-3-phosphate dehydrogenase (NAD(P)+)